MSEGGPVGMTAFKEDREMFSASNSTGPGFTCSNDDKTQFIFLVVNKVG